MTTQQEFDAFDSYYDDAKVRIDQRIGEVLNSNEDFILKRRALEHSVRGGKRIRPVLTLAASEVFDSPYDKALNHAVIVELIHNASLVADDRADMDEERRGDSTLWKVVDKIPFGKRGKKVATQASVLSANGLVGVAINLAQDPGVVKAVGRSLDKVLDGFFLEGYNMFTGAVSGGYERYVEINKAKTGGLYALSTWMPATYVDAPNEQVKAARKYGETVGILYQVADDIADDDLPSVVKDPEEELEKWHAEAIELVDEMPDHEKQTLLRTAPTWVVYKMFEQEGLLGEVTPDFLEPLVEEQTDDAGADAEASG